jgi:hypothetical protein
MPVQDATHLVRHRFVVVVAVHQHGEDPGDVALALGPRAGTLQQCRQFCEN